MDTLAIFSADHEQTMGFLNDTLTNLKKTRTIPPISIASAPPDGTAVSNTSVPDGSYDLVNENIRLKNELDAVKEQIKKMQEQYQKQIEDLQRQNEELRQYSPQQKNSIDSREQSSTESFDGWQDNDSNEDNKSTQSCEKDTISPQLENLIAKKVDQTVQQSMQQILPILSTAIFTELESKIIPNYNWRQMRSTLFKSKQQNKVICEPSLNEIRKAHLGKLN